MLPWTRRIPGQRGKVGGGSRFSSKEGAYFAKQCLSLAAGKNPIASRRGLNSLADFCQCLLRTARACKIPYWWWCCLVRHELSLPVGTALWLRRRCALLRSEVLLLSSSGRGLQWHCDSPRNSHYATSTLHRHCSEFAGDAPIPGACCLTLCGAPLLIIGSLSVCFPISATDRGFLGGSPTPAEHIEWVPIRRVRPCMADDGVSRSLPV